MRDLVGGPRRFVELQRTLPGISTEQLRSRLNRMVADGLLTRQRYREVPPRVDYELTERARDLLPVIGALARWGYQWTWSAPRPEELVDIGAILRSVPGLAVPRGFRSAIEVLVDRPEDAPRQYVLGVDSGHWTVEERSGAEADARISGPEAAWVAALGPEGERTGLTVEGDRTAAGAVLDALAPLAARESVVA